MKRIFIILGLLIAGLGLIAAPANAVVSVENGVGHVDKGDVQRVLNWNNKAFDEGVGTLKFTAGFTATYDNTLTCRSGQVTHVPVVSTGTGDVAATVIKSSNGKQINGWDLTGASSDSAVNDPNQIVAKLWTACNDGSIPINVYVAKTPSVTFDALRVNGVALPNTPVV